MFQTPLHISPSLPSQLGENEGGGNLSLYALNVVKVVVGFSMIYVKHLGDCCSG